MRISDWSSDVCSSDLHIPANPDYSSLNLAAAVQVLAYELRVALLDADAAAPAPDGHGQGGHADPTASHAQMEGLFAQLAQTLDDIDFHKGQIGRASCRERVCQYV